MSQFFDDFLQTTDPGTLIFSVLLAVTILIMLLAISSIHRRLRLMASDLASIKRDQTVMSEEMEVLATSRDGEPPSEPAV